VAKTINTSIEIGAPIDKVWETFVDFKRWPEWNPFVIDLSGNVAVGEKLSVRIRPPGGKAMTFKPKVLELESESELRWVGRFLIPGIFDGEHRFQLEPISANRTRFTQGEEFRGLLVGLLMGKAMHAKTTQGFENMNQALKDRVEANGG